MLNFKRLKYLCRRTVQILVDHSNLIPYHAVVDGCNGIRKVSPRSIVRCRCKTNCLLQSKDLLIDNEVDTVYTANASANAEIVLEFNTTAEVAGFKYRAPAGQSPVGSYVISLLCDGAWKDVASGAFGADQIQTIHVL